MGGVSPSQFGPETGVDFEQFRSFLEEGGPRDGLRLIDVREEEELSVEKIDGAEWIPLSRFAELWEQKITDSGQCLVFF